jgi:serpin B
MFQRFASIVLSIAVVAGVQAEEPKRQDGSSTHTVPMTPDARNLAQSNNRFATDLYGRLSAKESGNLFFSPYSISTALAMTSVGAEGQTKTQMAETLRFSIPEPRLHTAFASLRQTSQPRDSTAGYQLRIANRLWGQQGYHFIPAFQQTVRTNYGADLAPVDFARQTEAARRTINAWVEKETEQKIQDLIAPGVLDPMTRLVLTNAIYFKGAWTDEFKKAATQDAPFKSAGQQVMVPMMHQTDGFKYAAVDDLQILELPYGKDRQVSMVVLLPKMVDGLAQIEKKLTSENLQTWLAGLRKQEVRVFLPRFKMTSQFQLKSVLQSMGMTLAFTPGEADFSGISTEEELFISAVIHKAFVDVNEEGTEAAAATGVLIAPTSAPSRQEPVVFRADHPFVFLIRDNRSGSVLFLGRLMNPQ